MRWSKSSWQFAWAWAFAAALVAVPARAQTRPALGPFVAVEQDGKRIEESGGTIRLRRAPFTLVFTLPPLTTILAHASNVPTTYELARSAGAWSEIFARGGALAERAFNEQQMLYLADTSSSRYHTWYYDGPADHRFTAVRVDPATGAMIARRTIANVQMPDRAEFPIESYPGDQVFLVIGASGSTPGVTGERYRLQLSFAGRPTTAARATPAEQRTAARGTAAVRVGGGVPVPRRVYGTEPEYPAVARAARVEGVVMLEITVSATGSVVDTRVVRSIPLLDQAAVDAVRQWKYEPVRIRGTAVPVIMTTVVRFALGTEPPEPQPPSANSAAAPARSSAARRDPSSGS